MNDMTRFLTLAVLLYLVLMLASLSNVLVQADSSSLQTGSKTVHLPSGPMQSAFAPGFNKLYVSLYDSNAVEVINVSNDRLITQIHVGKNPYGLAYDGPAGKVFVADYGSEEVSVIDVKNDSLVDTIHVNQVVMAVAYDPVTGWVLVSSLSNNSILEISDIYDVVENSIPVGIQPDDIAVDVKTGDAYVTNYVSGTVSKISATTNDVTWTVSIGRYPFSIAVDPEDSRLYVSSPSSNTVYVINELNGSLITEIYVVVPTCVAFDSFRGYLLVSSCRSDDLFVFNGSGLQLLRQYQVEQCPVGITTVSFLEKIYVSNYKSDTLSDLFIGITFLESGLPSGTPWGVTVGNQSLSSTGGAIFLATKYGNYTYSVQPMKGFNSEIAGGSVNVVGNQTVLITFYPEAPAVIQTVYIQYLIPTFNYLSSISQDLLFLEALVLFAAEVEGLILLSWRHNPRRKDLVFCLVALGAVFFSFLMHYSISFFSFVFEGILRYNPEANGFASNAAVTVFVIIMVVAAVLFFFESFRVYFFDYLLLGVFYLLTHSFSDLDYNAPLPNGLTLGSLTQFGWEAPIIALLFVVGLLAASYFHLRRYLKEEKEDYKGLLAASYFHLIFGTEGSHVKLLPFILLGFILDLITLPLFFIACLLYLPFSALITTLVIMRRSNSEEN